MVRPAVDCSSVPDSGHQDYTHIQHQDMVNPTSEETSSSRHQEYATTHELERVNSNEITEENSSSQVGPSRIQRPSRFKLHYGCNISYLGCDVAFPDLESWEKHHRERHSNLAPEDVQPYMIYNVYCCSIDWPFKDQNKHRRSDKHAFSKSIGTYRGTLLFQSC